MGLPTPLARVLDAVQGTASPRVHQAPAVRWLSVPQLVRTAVDVLQASSFAKYADKRETMATSPREFYRLPAADEEPRDAVFVDYVADTGDGWNSTYAVAHALAQPELAVELDGTRRTTKRGDVLVFGGDEVYPVASREAYERKLIAAYRTALPSVEPPYPRVFAVAGVGDVVEPELVARRIVALVEAGMAQRVEHTPVGVPGEHRRDDDVQSRAHELAGVEPAGHRQPVSLGGRGRRRR